MSLNLAPDDYGAPQYHKLLDWLSFCSADFSDRHHGWWHQRKTAGGKLRLFCEFVYLLT
jgi:hypothetical protein